MSCCVFISPLQLRVDCLGKVIKAKPILLALFICLLAFLPVHAETLVPDDYPTIQDAINVSSLGETIVVRDGVYSVYLKINKSITLRSENGTANCILEASTSDDVIEVHASWVNISGFTIRNGSDDGIDVEPDPSTSNPSDHANISNNVLHNLSGGIQLESSGYAVVMDNNITNVSKGVYFLDSYGNLIVNNTISNSDLGIETDGAGSIIYLNRFINNNYNAVECGANGWNSTEVQNYTWQGNVYLNHTGNYWDVYSGSDSNNDGIGDSPYKIPSWADLWGGEGCFSNSYDFYPMLFETLQPPAISNVHEGSLTNSSVIITWDTNIPANNRILYSLNSDLSSPTWSGWDNNTTNPFLIITGLQGNTTYYYSAFSYRTDNASVYSNSSIRNFTTVRDPKTWYVDDDGLDCAANFSSIQDAVNASMNKDTIIVCNGSYEENVFVNKSLNIIGMENPVVDAGYEGSAFTLASNRNTIRGFTIKNTSFFGECYGSIPEAGVRVGYTTYKLVAGGCTMITDYESTDNLIRDNTFINSGIVLVKGWIQSGSDRNTIINNTFDASRIEIHESSYNNISFNTFFGQKYYGYISIEGGQLRNARNNLIFGNSFRKQFKYASLPLIYIKSYAKYTNFSNNIIVGYGGVVVGSDYCVIRDSYIEGYTPILDGDDGIHINHASHCQIINNTVKEKYSGIKIDTSSPYAYSTNLTLRNNTLQSNTYDFYFNPGRTDFPTSPTFQDFDHDIDTSNLVGGGAIYFLKNVSNAVFDQTAQPAIGFFACINCENVTLRNVGLSSNSHGIILYNTSDSIIDSVGAYYNHLAGVAVYYSSNVTVTNSQLSENGQSNYASGIYIGASENITVENDELNSNWCYGIQLESSSNNTILNSNITDNGPAYELSPVADDCYSGGSGLKIYDSKNNTVKSSYIMAKTIPISGSWKGGQKYGVHVTYRSTNNLIYNNYFNNSINAYDTETNQWNITPVEGSNIIGGPYLGGNYWHDYAGEDTAGGDGLGDTLLPYNSSGNIQNGGDFHPLTTVTIDTTPPAIHVVSPVEGWIYQASYIYLEVYSPDSDVYRWWYSLDGVNVSFTPNTTISGLSNGDYTLAVYVNDTTGNVNSTTVNFTVSIAGGVGGVGGMVAEKPLEEVTQPEFEITILSPEDEQYLQRDLQLSFTSPVPLRRSSLMLDGGNPETINIPAYATSASKQISRLSLGKHTITVNGEDYYGRKGKGEVEFEIVSLTLGEINATGTATSPRFVDDVAFSFFGRNADYILKFEAKGDAKIDIRINEYYRNGVQPYNNLSGGLVFSFTPLSSYREYEIPILANITADVENLLSFISENAGDGEKSWEIRNVTLIPSLPFSFPQISIFTFDKAISENETMTAYLKIDGVMREDYKAYIYLLTPDGKKLYHSSWNENKKPIDDYYLLTNYYGKLPSTLKFSNFTYGTYILVAKIVDSFDSTLSISTDKLYYSNESSVKLYINRDVFSEGQGVMVENMVTAGTTENGTLVISLENPDGELIYLPMLSEKQKGLEYAPIKSDYFIAFDEIVSNWKEGSYILRSKLYNESGDLLSDDILTFDVCYNTSTLEGGYLRKVEDNDNSAFVLSRIRLIDFYTLETQEFEFKGDHYGYSMDVKPGKYYIGGEAYSEKGIYYIPLVKVAVGCGESKTRNLELEYLSKTNMTSIAEKLSYNPLGELNVNYHAPLKFDELNACSKPKVGVLVTLENEYALNMLRDDMKLLYGQDGYENAGKEKIERYFMLKLVELLKSSGIEVYGLNEILSSIEQSANTENPGNPDLSRISASLTPDYVYKVSISGDKDLAYYFVGSSLIAIPGYTIVNPTHFYSSSISDPMNEIARAVRNTGDLKPIIDDFEIRNPVPPRDPKLEVSVVPESISPDSSEKKATIKARVTDCRGNPAVRISEYTYGVLRRQEVYFQKYTERGVVRADWEALKVSMHGEGDWEILRAKNWVIGDTRERGIAKAEYTLRKGIEAGEDRVRIITFGRGMKKASATAIIKIAGVKIEIKPEKEEIIPKSQTMLRIHLYKEDKDGKRTPISGKSVVLGKGNLLDGKVNILGNIDGQGNPITDSDGKALIKYTAGKKEGMVKIPVRYQTELGEVRDTAYIKVREKEFVLLITYNAFSKRVSAGSNKHQSSCPILCCPKISSKSCYPSTESGSVTEDSYSELENSYSFSSRTNWKMSERFEKTTATLIRTAHSSAEKTWSGSYLHCVCSGSSGGSYHGSREGMVTSHVTDRFSDLIIELENGDLYLLVKPVYIIPPYFLMKGVHSEDYSSSFSSSGVCNYEDEEPRSYRDSSSDSGTYTCLYDGNSSTRPGGDCLRRWFAERVTFSIPYSWMTKKSALILKRIGKEKWEDVSVDYTPKGSSSGSGSYSYGDSSSESYSSSRQWEGEYHLYVRVVKR